MRDGIQLKYGWIRGGISGFPIDITDAEVFAAQSGRFLFRNVTTGYGEIANTTDDIIGHAEFGGDDSSTSNIKVMCINDLAAVFRIPLAYDASSYTVNYSVAILGECCDLVVSGGVQYANPTVATNKSLLIVGGKAAESTTIVATDGYLDVQINPSALGNLGVGA